MALDANVLAALMMAEVAKLAALPTAADYYPQFYLALARAVVTHINAAAELDGTVTSGLGAGGAVIGKVL